MQVDSLSSSTVASTTTAKSSSASLASSYQSFLTLLLKQLEVQDPTNPVDTAQYTSQLVQLSSLEQQMSMSDKLDELTSAVQALGTGSSALGYLGRTVTAEGDTTALQNGAANWEYSLNSEAAAVTLTVRDEDGAIVYQDSGATGQGSHAFTWDGTGRDGAVHTSGTYSLTVTAVDSSKAAIATETRIKGTVTSVDTSGTTAALGIGGVSVSADDVLSLS
ncbi:flagellar hook assembly protein FlgD [Azospirillum brasilense]|uniref:Basal-body rod modification protein FlgD n=1 Tax=Azospirillum brasilense TaxID=192 RepID=A0A235HH78_AZOBR|nr:flagellar hook capping FlgD N-terminal domain-containing protein [Azospirillum brasilense]OYD84824.1 flagellar biosynthesis protein FlgD [Azospirillum brasilense]